MKPYPPAVLIAMLLVLSFIPWVWGQDRQLPPGITVREGFRLSVAANVPNARFLCLNPDGTLYVSQPQRQTITALRDRDGDGYYEWSQTYVANQKSVHGMFWHEGELWFTRSDAVLRSRDTDNDGKADQVTEVLTNLPSGGHWWRPVLIHKNRIYTAVGDSGNITDETQTDRQKIWSYALDSSDKKLFASGLRNTEKLLLRPGTEEIWGMDHGSDWFGKPLGDKQGRQPITDYHPPDEMNRYVEGGFYGHPFIVGDKLPRYEYMNRQDIIELAEKTITPEWAMPAHSACNAMTFYTGEQFPQDHRGDAFVAMHGSWNRKKKDGYGVARVLFDQGQPYGMLIYVSFLAQDGNRVLGRPVDITTAPDGSLLISDDQGNRVYRLSYIKATP